MVSGRLRVSKRWIFGMLAIVLLAAQSYLVAGGWLIKWTTATWLREHVVPYSKLVADIKGQEVQLLMPKSEPESTWGWHFEPFVETKAPLVWQGEGDQYLLIDERTFPDKDFSKRVEEIAARGATLLYQSHPLLPLGPRQAVFWTFKPDHPLNVTFANSLLLLGYNIQRSQNGHISLLFQWYTVGPPTISYHLFLHIVETASGKIVGQADTQVGQVAHPTVAWHRNELVFETVELPPNVIGPLSGAFQLRLGLYDLDTGTRAPITNSNNQPLGDNIVVDLSL